MLNFLNSKKMLRYKEDIGFVAGFVATVARSEYSSVVHDEYGVILPPPYTA